MKPLAYLPPALLALLMFLFPGARLAVADFAFLLQFPASLSEQALDGRLLLMVSTDSAAEPRFQIVDGPESQQVFGIDVEGMKPGGQAPGGAAAFGYPLRSLANLPAGEYYVQALLHVYETFHLKTGHTVKLPMDRGEGQQWNLAPGNLYSKAMKMRINPALDGRVELVLDQKIPPIKPSEDTKYVKHVRIQSKLLTEFWGRPMYLGAHLLLPEGYDEHPEAG